jgi:integrase/recombinase XerD
MRVDLVGMLGCPTNRRIAMPALRPRLLEDLQLRGLAPKPQPCDLEAVNHLAPPDRRAPDQLSDEASRPSLLCRLNEKQVAASTCRMHLSGIRCFSERSLRRPWPVFALARPRKRQKLPVVLGPQEVRSLVALVNHPTARLWLQMLYACGRRWREGPQRQVSAMDSPRRLVRIRQGQGGQGR